MSGFRKRRRPTPGFKIPPPFNPVTGAYGSLDQKGISPYCALMQVAAEDVHLDYVICRGFDTRIVRFVDYEEGNPYKPGISVAKPFGNRSVGAYEVGGIYPAVLPIQGTGTFTPPSPIGVEWRLGQNPGVVATNPAADGQPRDLTETVVLLYDNTGRAVNWLMIDSGTTTTPEPTPPPDPEPACQGQCLWKWNHTTKLWEIVEQDCTRVDKCSIDKLTQAGVQFTVFWDFSVVRISNLTCPDDPRIRPGDIIRYEFDAVNISGNPGVGQRIEWGARRIVARFFNLGVTLIDNSPIDAIIEVVDNYTSVVWNDSAGPNTGGYDNGYTGTYYIDLQISDECVDLELLAYPRNAITLIDSPGSEVSPAITRRRVTYGVYDVDTQPGADGDCLCHCQQPIDCGEVEGDQVATYCTSLQVKKPECGQDDDCDCPPPPPECTSCSWQRTLRGWILLATNCPAPFCICRQPSTSTECGETVYVECESLPLAPPPCDGECWFIWVPGVPEGYWSLSGNTCTRPFPPYSAYGLPPCTCEPPSAPPPDPEDVCVEDSTPCLQDRDPCLDKCDPCPPGTISTETTYSLFGINHPIVECVPGTTVAPCDALGCSWQWVRSGGPSEDCIGYWFKVADDCPAECPCGYPPLDLPFTASDCSGNAKTRCDTASPTTTTTTTPAPTGKCCTGDLCSVTTEADCAGDWLLDGTCVGDFPCGTPVGYGACCPPIGPCFVSTEVVCANEGGHWSGGRSCADVSNCRQPLPGDPCEIDPVPWACCFPPPPGGGVLDISIRCWMLTCVACRDVGGTWLEGVSCGFVDCGDGVGSTTTTTTTTTTPAPDPVGACCTSGVCTVTSESACVAGGGSFMGDADCSLSPCVEIPPP